MNGNLFVTAFLTLPIADAIIGTKVNGIMAFQAKEILKRIRGLNGNSNAFKVVELELEVAEGKCKICDSGSVMIPRTAEAVIKKSHDVKDFINLHDQD